MNSLRAETGSITLWLLGLTVLLLGLGGLGLDLWRAYSHRQALVGLADAAAVAAASSLDPVELRAGRAALDPPRARHRALRALAVQKESTLLVDPPRIDIQGPRVRVLVRGELPLTVLGLLAGGQTLTVEAAATAVARRAGPP